MHKVSMQLIRKIQCYNDWQLRSYPMGELFYICTVFVWCLVIMCVGSVKSFCNLGLIYVPFSKTEAEINFFSSNKFGNRWAVLSAVKSLIILLASVLIIVVCRALHIAARKGDFSMVIKLLRLGADPLLVNSSHHTPLQLIAIKVGGACFLCTKDGSSFFSLGSISHPKILPKLLRKVPFVDGHVDVCVRAGMWLLR